MALINTEVKLWDDYLQNFPWPFGRTDISLAPTPASQTHLQYYDRQDLFYCRIQSDERNGGASARVDANLIDTTSAQVGEFNSPITNSPNGTFFVGDFDVAAGTQMILDTLGANQPFGELDPNNPEILLDGDRFPNIDTAGNNTGASTTDEGWCGAILSGDLNFVFFEGIDRAIVTNGRVRQNGANQSRVIAEVTLSTGLATSMLPGRYAAASGEFNRGAIFGETDVTLRSIQFLPDDDSTHARPKGQLLFGANALPAGGGLADRVYVRINDYNPTDKVAASGTPNRIHLRETLLSRVEFQVNTVPVGFPLVPTDACAAQTSSFNPDLAFTTRGSKRLQLIQSDGWNVTGATTATHYSLAADPFAITTPSDKGLAQTNRTVSYQTQVVGSLGEEIANAAVTWSLTRISSVGEVLPTTGSGGETVEVENFPIDRTQLVYDFDVLKDGVPMTEGAGADEYTVNEATGEITFGASEPTVGPVYTINYAHPAAPATPSHGTLVDVLTFTNVGGAAETRVAYPDDATLVAQIDELQADTPT